MTTTSRTPVHTDRHRRLDTSVWENGSNGQRFYNTTLRKSWKHEEEWKESRVSLGRENLLPAAALLQWADAAIGTAIEQEQTADGKEPIASKRRGLLEATVFHKEQDERSTYAVKLRRSYKDGDDWKETAVWLSADDVLAAARLLLRTFDGIDAIIDGSNRSFVDQAKEAFDGTVVEDDIPF
ncbi:MAG: hypothetical protein R3C28_33345 [Pirellulaceae bacterium]